jgi:Tfp pilus assembly protein PilO
MKKKKTLQLLLITVFLLVSAVFGYLIVKESLLIRRQTAEINSIEAIIEEQQVLLQKMKGTEVRSAEYEACLSKLQKFIPEEPEQNQFIVWVYEASESVSLNISDISFGEHTVEGGYSVMPVHLALQGSYNSMLEFLSSLMYGERLVRVDDVDLFGGERLSMNMRINLFYKNPSKAIAKNVKG